MPPKKATKMSLNDFLADQTTGSWADEATQIPTAPVSSFSSDTHGHSRPTDSYRQRDSSTSRTRSDRPPREQRPIPSAPPFIAFVGNIPHACTESDLEELVKELKVVSVRLVRDREGGGSRGFGYIEFEDAKSLETALGFTGNDFHGRPLKMDVAESQGGRSGGRSGDRGPRREDERMERSWRRDEPLGGRGGSRDRSDRPPRRDRDEPEVDLGAFRRGEKSDAPKSNWESRQRNGRDRPQFERPLYERKFDGDRPPRDNDSRGPRRGGRKDEKSEEEIKAMEQKIAAMRMGK